MRLSTRLARTVLRELSKAAGSAAQQDGTARQPGQSRQPRRTRRGRPGPRAGQDRTPPVGGSYDRPVVTFSPEADGLPDPGEVVWTWVPYEEDPQQGKDRPVIVLARRGAEGTGDLLCLMLTSKDHDRDAEDEAHWGRYWMDIGTGPWDSQGRPSEVRLDRLLVLPEADVRREGAALDRGTFDAVVAAARPHHPDLG